MDPIFGRWLATVFSFPDLLDALAIAGRTAAIYVLLLVGLRLLGKRELGQMSIYDLVLVIVLANAVQNAMLGHDTTLGGGLVAAFTLLALNRVFTWLIVTRREIRDWMIGEPVLIVREGHLLTARMRAEGVTREHVMAAMREHGIDRLEDVQMAVLETDGEISIVPRESRVQRTRHKVRGLRVS